jgi:DNA-binding ferritin-like protein (Dps family)
MTMSEEEKGGFISKVIGKVIGPKRRWRAYKARVRQLPENYRMAVDAIERYLMHFGPMDAGSAEALLEDVADLFERAAADGTPIREIVGADPVEFVEALVANYEKGGYVTRERNRLINSIEQAAGEDTGKGKGTVR